MKTMLRQIAIVGASVVMLTGCAKKSMPGDAKLAALQARMDSAVNQGDMNIISCAIFEHLDRKLAMLEDLIRKDLGEGESRDLFEKSIVLWREYRDAHAAFEVFFYEGGSIRPLVYNETRTKLTEDRIAALLVAMGPEILYWENGQGGWQ